MLTVSKLTSRDQTFISQDPYPTDEGIIEPAYWNVGWVNLFEQVGATNYTSEIGISEVEVLAPKWWTYS